MTMWSGVHKNMAASLDNKEENNLINLAPHTDVCREESGTMQTSNINRLILRKLKIDEEEATSRIKPLKEFAKGLAPSLEEEEVGVDYDEEEDVSKEADRPSSSGLPEDSINFNYHPSGRVSSGIVQNNQSRFLACNSAHSINAATMRNNTERKSNFTQQTISSFIYAVGLEEEAAAAREAKNLSKDDEKSSCSSSSSSCDGISENRATPSIELLGDTNNIKDMKWSDVQKLLKESNCRTNAGLLLALKAPKRQEYRPRSNSMNDTHGSADKINQTGNFPAPLKGANRRSESAGFLNSKKSSNAGKISKTGNFPAPLKGAQRRSESAGFLNNNKSTYQQTNQNISDDTPSLLQRLKLSFQDEEVQNDEREKTVCD